MGTMIHHAIIATTYDGDAMSLFKDWCERSLDEKERSLISFTEAWINHYHSFTVSPDGSKEGWEESGDGDQLREKIIGYITGEPFCFEDGSNVWDWVEVFFGDYGHGIGRGSCEDFLS